MLSIVVVRAEEWSSLGSVNSGKDSLSEPRIIRSPTTPAAEGPLATERRPPVAMLWSSAGPAGGDASSADTAEE